MFLKDVDNNPFGEPCILSTEETNLGNAVTKLVSRFPISHAPLRLGALSTPVIPILLPEYFAI